MPTFYIKNTSQFFFSLFILKNTQFFSIFIIFFIVELKKWAETVGISEKELEKAKIEAGLSENAEKTAENAEKTAENAEKTAENAKKAGLKRENSENEGTRKSKRVKKWAKMSKNGSKREKMAQNY
jgi:hypothetical protein